MGVIVSDLSAKAFFLDFGLEVQGEGEVEGERVDHINPASGRPQNTVAVTCSGSIPSL